MSESASDALVLYGVTGDLAYKMIFPALYGMAKRRSLTFPIIGVALEDWSAATLHQRIEESLKQAGGIDDPRALRRLLARVKYVSGNYKQDETFAALKAVLGNAMRPAHYLAIPPALFGTVIEGIGHAGIADKARVIIEKPFGRDRKSAEELNAIARSVFPEDSIFRIDHFLGKEAIMNILYFRFANSFLEPIWNRDHIARVQITHCEKFGVEGRGNFYESAGCLRDVIENHLFQIVTLLAMEPPAYRGFGAVHREKAKVLHAMHRLAPSDVVRGQYIGYRKEKGVAKDSDVETYCAMRLMIDSWRWSGVPWLLRSGKCMPHTAAEILVEFKPPPQRLFDDSIPDHGLSNYVRLRLSPRSELALAARVKTPGQQFVGEQRELLLLDEHPAVHSPYERLLTDAMAGDGALFTREESVEAAWSVVDRVLKRPPKAIPYRRGTWGPAQASRLFKGSGSWNDPR